MADREGLYSGHAGVTYPADKPKFSELKLLSVEAEDELEKRNEEIKKRFVEFFGA